MSELRKGPKDEFAPFFENPTRETLRNLLEHHTGESDNADFKRDWQDWPKVARHVLAMANSGGGAIFIGVREEEDGRYASIGVDSLVDKAVLHQQLDRFLPAQLEYEVLDFSYEASEYPPLVGKKFQVLLIGDTPRYIPFVATGDGEGIHKSEIYVRSGTRSTKASYEELQEVINRRIDTGYSSANELALQEHLAELKVLYNQIPRYLEPFAPLADVLRRQMLMEDNPEYPSESFPQFIHEMISIKKETIRRIVART